MTNATIRIGMQRMAVSHKQSSKRTFFILASPGFRLRVGRFRSTGRFELDSVAASVGSGCHELPRVGITKHAGGMKHGLNLHQIFRAGAELSVLVMNVEAGAHRTARDSFEHGAVEIFVFRGSPVDSRVTLFVYAASAEDWMHDARAPLSWSNALRHCCNLKLDEANG